MLEDDPVVVGVPVSAPVNVLKVAQAGLLLIENASVSPLASDAVGENEYAVPTWPVVAGVPESVGAVLAVLVTLIEKVGKLALPPLPSLTEITMPAKLPCWAALGVPVRAPVVVLKAAQDGLLVIE